MSETGLPRTGRRLQQVLAQAGVASRRAAERLIQEGRVQVDGVRVTELGVRVTPDQRITVDGQSAEPERQRYLLLHKPCGVVCTMRDPQGRRTVAELLRPVPERIVPVGRLDYNTSGVLLLTNDGHLARALLHPSRKVEKHYQLEVRGRLDAQALARLRSSIVIDGRATLPAAVEVEARSGGGARLSVVLREGRNRQIRRLAEHAGLGVVRLERTRFAGLGLAGLAAGRFRDLTPAELARLRVAVGSPGR